MKSIVALTLLVGCGGATWQSKPASPAAAAVKPADAARATRLTLASIACFTSGVWDDLQGDRPDACAFLAVDAIGARSDDTTTRAAVRAIEPRAVDMIVEAIGDTRSATLVRSVAGAAREAIAARAAAARIRKAGGDAVQVDADDAPLAAHDALQTLASLKSPTSSVVALVLAADRLENVRGLPPRAKLAAAAPAFEVMFGVTRPAYFVPGAWLGYVTDAARAAGHDAPAKGTTREREQAAFMGVAAGLAERFELAAKTSDGEVKTVASAYARRLRVAVAERSTKSLASN